MVFDLVAFRVFIYKKIDFFLLVSEKKLEE